MTPAEQLAAAGYRKVPSIKTDERLIPYWQRWVGGGSSMDWFEFPHDLPVDLVWSCIESTLNAGWSSMRAPADRTLTHTVDSA